jgi:AhpD family alkylhydroperoxidase
MTLRSTTLTLIISGAIFVATPGMATADDASATKATTAAPAAPAAAAARTDSSLESNDRVPEYLKVLAQDRPDAAAAFARLMRTTLFGGTIPPSFKASMGARVAETCHSTYAKAHLLRLAKALPPQSAEDSRLILAVRYAEGLTRSVNGISQEQFAQLRSHFNDAQIVELTLTTCFFNYFSRLTSGLRLKPEPWLAGTTPHLPKPSQNPYASARVSLLTDDEIKATVDLATSGANSSLGIGIPNSRRAMARVPDIGGAWWDYLQAARKGDQVPRSTLLQVSLAVSTMNGCRYCIVHQVVGLRRQGVEVGKLLSLKKDDSQLTREEKTAVDFARKLTKEPGRVTDSDWAALSAAFPDKQAMSVLLQTCTFAFMNRFTDNLNLPSEEEAIHIYQEVYGKTPVL